MPVDVGDVSPARRPLELLAPTLLAFAPVVGLAAAQGGYFPTAWGWASVPLFWAAAVAATVRSETSLSREEAFFLAALAAFILWIVLSIAWSVAPAESVLEVERALVYAAAAFAVLLLSPAHASRYVLGATLAAIAAISAFSLATRLVPDRVGVYDGSGIYRLAQPIGYWNGLALFAAIGSFLAFGFAARARTIGWRAVASALLVLLIPTMYFTFSRGAWLALGVGLVTAVAVDPRRLQLVATLLAVGPAPALAVLIASHEKGLTHGGSTLAAAAHDGHRLALVLVLLAVWNAAVAAASALIARRVEVGRTVRRVFAVTVGVVIIVTGSLVLARYGGPVHVVKRAYASFKAPLPEGQSNLNRRLLTLSGNGRSQLWGLAWDLAKRHPVLGAGAGTYERYFLAHEPVNVSRVRDAHNLYVETLAELGPVGLALLIATLATPLVVLRRARHHPLAPAAAGAYVAYVVHTGVDWDWELPAVTLAGLLCASAILLMARSSAPGATRAPWLRWALTVGTAAAAVFCTVGLLGNTALSRSATAREHGDQAAAANDARRARLLMPWSPAPWEALGRAQLAAGLPAAARHSFRKAISIDSGDWELWYDLAGVTQGRERSRSLERVAQLFPQSSLSPPGTNG
jgi:hypothetical protein